MSKLRIVFVGCVRSSLAMLEELAALPEVEICGVVTRQSSDINADFVDLSGFAAHRGIPTFYATAGHKAEMAAWIKNWNADVCFCLGWSYLLDQSALTATRLGVVGYHPALLPRNRGRHPIIWALALGLMETGSTFFFMDAGADSGPILSQVRVPIDAADDAGSLYDKLIGVARGQLRQLASDLHRGVAIAVPQDPAKASSWRKRGKEDGCIDWRMPAQGIHNLVRALSQPYPGAHTTFGGTKIKVWKTRLGGAGFKDVEPGYVLEVIGPDIHVQCGVGTIVLEKHGFEGTPGRAVQRGDYLI